jgi:hypothetical protein
MHLGDIMQWVQDCRVTEKLAETAIRFIAPQAAQQYLEVAAVQVHKLLGADLVVTVWAVVGLMLMDKVVDLLAAEAVVEVATA